MSKSAAHLLIAAVTLSSLALSQSSGSSPAQSDPEGKVAAGYQVQQSIEFGYRFTDVQGSNQVYNTFINQHEGPRLLDQTLDMNSVNHSGLAFDRLSFSTFGWGGDPENAARLRISKNLWYDFGLSFRRDRNFFDYNLLANPLNPPTSTPSIAVPFSPHQMQIARRMYDVNLTLMPESRFTVRLGYSRNRSEGPSFSSFHEGTDPLLNQLWNVSSNDFFIGFDLKVLPHTSISYDQAIQFDKNDTDYNLAPFAQFPLANGTPVSLGLPFNTDVNQPCGTPILPTGVASPRCNLYISYLRNQRVRTTTPTERLSLHSDFKRVNFFGDVSYSSADLDSPYLELFNGLVSRTSERQFSFSGPASVRRIAVNSYAGVTVTLTNKINLSDSFRFDNFRIPGQWNSTATSVEGIPVGTPPAVNVLLSPLGPLTTTTALTANFLGQKSFSNQIQLEYTPSKYAGVRVGYRFRHRHVFKSEPEIEVDPESGIPEFEGDDIDVNEHTPMFGLWVRPTDSLRINVEAEAMAADNFITRISPRQRQNYRARLNYKPRRWATLALSTDITESRNGESDTQFNQHYRNAGFMLSLLPNDRIGLDLAYNYTAALQAALICFNGSFTPSGTIIDGCPTFDSADNNNPNSIRSNYVNNTHYGSATVRFKPVKRLTAVLGYGLTRSQGDETILNPLQPFGPLQFTYHQPVGSLSYEFVRNVSFNAAWNYDQYNEDSFVGPTAPRYFHDNRTTLSLRYAF
jgi:opacity protein-like surface antigen